MSERTLSDKPLLITELKFELKSYRANCSQICQIRSWSMTDSCELAECPGESTPRVTFQPRACFVMCCAGDVIATYVTERRHSVSANSKPVSLLALRLNYACTARSLSLCWRIRLREWTAELVSAPDVKQCQRKAEYCGWLFKTHPNRTIIYISAGKKWRLVDGTGIH